MEILEQIKKKCAEALSQAAYDSYYETGSERFEECDAMIDLEGTDAQIQVNATWNRKNGDIDYKVTIYHDNENETPNIENAIADYLYEHCDPMEDWRRAYDEDDRRGVDEGCDPAFPTGATSSGGRTDYECSINQTKTQSS